MQIDRTEIYVKGKPVLINSIEVEDKTLIVQGKLIKTARIKKEWYEDVEKPESIIRALRNIKAKPDIFTFWQRLPETKPRFNFYMEWEAIAALPIISFDHWWKKQISSSTRNMIRKSTKKGVVVKLIDFNDELVRGITSIYNEIPIRQNKKFWHYGEDFNTVKKAMLRDIDLSDFIGAYYKDQLIGFIKLVYSDKFMNFANTVQCLSMFKHRDKAVTNALIAKAVETCEKNKTSYLAYGEWRIRSLGAFLRHNGFESILLPRYYVSLTLKGKIILKLKLHNGIKRILPDNLMERLIGLRTKWYIWKYKVQH